MNKMMGEIEAILKKEAKELGQEECVTVVGKEIRVDGDMADLMDERYYCSFRCEYVDSFLRKAIDKIVEKYNHYIEASTNTEYTVAEC